ncbi:MAG: F420-dependent oxidoreductase-like protein [Gammaproteobacteria bacterium]|jgi:F420-dependent oxidoreductase-like protein
MRTSIQIGSAGAFGLGWSSSVEYVQEAERLGVDDVWSAEAWGQDAVTPLAYLAAKTNRVRLGTGIMQISARAPAMTAMTAMTLSTLSEGRFVLGLGVSGPQVVEGMHGVPFDPPLGRLRETVEVIKMAFRGEKIAYSGKHMVFPLPGGEGKPIAIEQAPTPDLPIYLATLGPRSLAYTGEAAHGWLGTTFIPDRADAVFPHIRAGAQRAGREFEELDIQVGGRVYIGDNVEEMLETMRPIMAFQLGGMGSPTRNFYNDCFKRAGFEEAASEIQSLWTQRRRKEAAQCVPDEMILKSNLVGTEAMVRERIAVYRDAGVTTLRLYPVAKERDASIAALGRAVELVHDVCAS